MRMAEWFKWVVELLRALTPEEAARASAYGLAPGAILLFMVTGVFGGYFTAEPPLPISISELKTEIHSGGKIVNREGVAFIIEPSQSEFRVTTRGKLTQVWSSLTRSQAQDNASQLTVGSNSLNVKAPFLGTAEPVTIIAPAPIQSELSIPGGTEKINSLVIRTKRSVTTLAGILLVCMFAFGMASALGMPARK